MENEDNFDRQTELNNCNFVKTVLMFLVVFYHSILYWSGNWFVGEPVYASGILAVIGKWLNSFHIYGFALISGYLFFFLKYEKGRYQQFGNFLLTKAKRLLVPYVFVSIIWVIPLSLCLFEYDIGDIVSKIALGVSPGQLWFLLMLFALFMIFFPLSEFFRKNQS